MAQSVGFNASNVPAALLNLERVWRKTRADQNGTYGMNTPLLKAIWEQQTADLISGLTENDGCKPVTVAWLETALAPTTELNNQPAAAKTGVTCSIDGAENASSNAQYTMDDALVRSFKIKEKDCGNLFQFDNKFQQASLAHITQMINDLAKKGANLLADSAGISLTPGKNGTYGGDVASYSAATDAQRKLLILDQGNFNGLFFPAWVAEIAEQNHLSAPYVIDSNNLLYFKAQAGFQQGTGAGDIGAQNGFDSLRASYRDGLTMASAGLNGSTFIVDQGAIALFTAAFFPETPEDVDGDGFKYTIYRTTVPGLTQANGRPVQLDTTVSKKKLPIVPGSTICENYFVFEYRLWYLPLLNPMLSANDGVTGVIRVKAR